MPGLLLHAVEALFEMYVMHAYISYLCKSSMGLTTSALSQPNRNAKKHMEKNQDDEPASSKPRHAPKAAAKKAAAAPPMKRRRRS